MKKVLAMMLAAATTLSIGVTALADDINVLEEPTESSSSEASSPESSSSEESSSEESSSEASSSEASSSETSSDATSSDATSSDVDTDVDFKDATGIAIGADEDGVVLGDDILEPGTEYKFPVSMIVGGKSVKITDENIKEFKFRYSKVSTKGMSRFEIEEYKGQYYLYVESRDTMTTKPVDVKYNVKLTPKSTTLPVFSQEVKFQYGYEELGGDYIDSLDKGDSVEIDNNNPVITASQFNKIAKINDYKNVTLAGNGWEFTVNVTDETTKNLVHSNAGIKEILAKFPDQDFKFFTFGGKPTFAGTGKLSLDVDDIVDDFDKMYTYRYADGKLYRINATFDADENTLSFRTNKLDNFLVTNELIKDGTVVTEVDNDSSSSDKEENTDKNNPTTGANDMINVAVMAAIASLAAAGTMVTKKLSK
ncbi:hypothetical protein [uncultured Anaerotruncus sp.]|uniref:hypothetical protein n=1 Tax=uncultured Anaerotruncus sp. TaxID=905011 RepID=UPI00280A8310|nr:hypothetical protein [uncultured Anaerotruncus sp.]